jgi:hypothetical protein
MMKAKTKIWVGVGAFVLAGGASTGAHAADGQNVKPAHVATDKAIDLTHAHDTASRIVIAQASAGHGGHAAAGGEGGEGGEAGATANLPPDLAFAVSIGQLRGHLLVGDELVKQGEWNAALPHFLHPSEEIYGKIEPQLKDYNTPEFSDALKTLSQTVKSKKGGKDYAKAFKAVEEALAATDAGLKAKHSNWDGFTVEAAVELIKASSGEYEEAIVKGRIAKPVEYQDSRGFIWEAEKMIKSVAPALEKKDAEAAKKTLAALAELKKAFPKAMPPKKPVKDHAALLSDISRIELAAGKLM